jgi:ABC-type transport system involved in multi-copper enzyme maturation permease subunit
MINSMQIAIIKKDLSSLVFNKRLFPLLLIVPCVFTVVLPTIFVLITYLAPDEVNELRQLLDLLPLSGQSDNMQHLVIGLLLNYVMPTFFIIIPVIAATVMAASSFVGEKEKRTLETLLYCPLTLRQIFQSKILASFILSMLVSFGSFLIMILVVEMEILFTSGTLLLPNVNWLVTMLLISPAISLMAVTLIVRGSAKAQTMDEAQQRSVFLILPILFLVTGQFTGLFLMSVWMLLGLGIILTLIAGLLMKGCIQRLSYEIVLK